LAACAASRLSSAVFWTCREGFPVLIQLLRHFGDDDAQKIHHFTEGGEGEGRGGGTGFGHYDFRDRG
jgi:hypothetical protein